MIACASGWDWLLACSGRVACRIRPEWTQIRHIIGRHDRASLEPPVALPQWGRSAYSDRDGSVPCSCRGEEPGSETDFLLNGQAHEVEMERYAPPTGFMGLPTCGTAVIPTLRED